MWQDVIFSIGSVIFAIALLPSVFSNDKPALATSVMTGTVLVIFTITYATLGLWSTAIINGMVSTIWWVLAWQVFRLHHNK